MITASRRPRICRCPCASRIRRDLPSQIRATLRIRPVSAKHRLSAWTVSLLRSIHRAMRQDWSAIPLSREKFFRPHGCDHRRGFSHAIAKRKAVPPAPPLPLAPATRSAADKNYFQSLQPRHQALDENRCSCVGTSEITHSPATDTGACLPPRAASIPTPRSRRPSPHNARQPSARSHDERQYPDGVHALQSKMGAKSLYRRADRSSSCRANFTPPLDPPVRMQSQPSPPFARRAFGMFLNFRSIRTRSAADLRIENKHVSSLRPPLCREATPSTQRVPYHSPLFSSISCTPINGAVAGPSNRESA